MSNISPTATIGSNSIELSIIYILLRSIKIPNGNIKKPAIPQQKPPVIPEAMPICWGIILCVSKMFIDIVDSKSAPPNM